MKGSPRATIAIVSSGLSSISKCRGSIAHEKELKGWKRSKKIALIKSVDPTWTDLSRDWYEYEPADYRRALDRMET
jgi:hypothetical protein